MAFVSAGGRGGTLARWALGSLALSAALAACEVREIYLPYEKGQSVERDAATGDAAMGVGGAGGVKGIPDSGQIVQGMGGAPIILPGSDASPRTCVRSTTTKQIPLGIYAMLDQSDSMAGARWASVVGAVKEFVQARASYGMFLGVQYFPLKKASTDPLLGLPTAVTVCDPVAYRTPQVPIAALPGISPAIIASLEQGGPTAVQELLGFPELVLDTPTDVALEGAIQGALDWRAVTKGEVVDVVPVAAVLLVTDGLPEAIIASPDCNPTLESTVAVAREGFEKWGISTYVLGVGEDLSELDRIADAGGTDRAIPVLEANEGEGSILLALDRIRDEALSCELGIPPGDTGRINVNVQAPDTDSSLPLQNVGSAEGCQGRGGWYYDDPASPSSIILCDESCGVGQVFEVEVGCETVTR